MKTPKKVETSSKTYRTWRYSLDWAVPKRVRITDSSNIMRAGLTLKSLFSGV